MKRSFFVICAVFAAGVVNAQLVASNAMSPQQLVEQILVGEGVQVFNVTYNGQPNVPGGQNAIGSFTNSNTILPLTDGVVLSTGNVNNMLAGSPQTSTGSGAGTDADLVMLANRPINDRSVLEFDFIPIGDTISFRFVFGSTEYNSYTCSSFNDAFGFFISGPGINGPFSNNAKNIALIPGTNVPISINSVNAGTHSDPSGNCAAADPNWQANSIYFQANNPPVDLKFNGFTVVLTAFSEVQCGEMYHIKLAIGDGQDSILDSVVFLEGGSFASTPIIPTITQGPNFIPPVEPGEPSTILRSCYPIDWVFTRTGTVDVPVTATLTVGGSVVSGEDYMPDFPMILEFAAGQTDMVLEMMFPLDQTGLDTLILTINSPSMCTGLGIINVFRFYVDDPPALTPVGYDMNIQCSTDAALAPVITGGYEPYTIDWGAQGGQEDTLHVSPLEITIYTANVTDDCGLESSTQFMVGLVELPPILMTVIGPTTVAEGCATSQLNILRPWEMEGDLTISITTSGTAENNVDYQLPSSVVLPEGNFNVLVPFVPIADNIDEGEESAMVVITFTDACGRSVDAFTTFTIIDAPPIELVGGEYFFPCSNDSVMLAVQASGGYNNELTVYWGDVADGVTGTEIFTPVTHSTGILVTAVDACGNSETTMVNVMVDCEVVIPNVFSPNGDGVNDVWEIEGINFTTNTVRVYNRWGKLVMDAQNYQNNWRGTDMPDGTYFYEIVIDRHEKPYNGYVTIMRNNM